MRHGCRPFVILIENDGFFASDMQAAPEPGKLPTAIYPPVLSCIFSNSFKLSSPNDLQ
jgi:hypothetical protein